MGEVCPVVSKNGKNDLKTGRNSKKYQNRKINLMTTALKSIKAKIETASKTNYLKIEILINNNRGTQTKHNVQQRIKATWASTFL